MTSHKRYERLTLTDLVGKGYLPKELPPPFTTKSLGNHANRLVKSLPKKRRPSKTIDFSIPLQGGGRRILEIPNPLNQLRLSESIADNWQEIKRYTEDNALGDNQIGKKILSQSKLKIVNDSERAIEPIGEHYLLWREIRKERIQSSITAKYLLRLDIANFYSSIYTHSIPWALHGKKEAKKVRTSDLFGNDIDTHVRNCKDAQTSGIPIGPDTSRIISEVIATAIDRYVLEKRNKPLNGIRFIDDYYLYFPTQVELEETYVLFQEAAAEYELNLNLSKVRKIETAEEVFDRPWVNQLRRFMFRKNPEAQYNDIIYFFDLVTQLSKQYPNDSVIYYGLKKLTSFEPRSCDLVELMHSLLLRTLQINAYPIQVILQLFLKNRPKTNGLAILKEALSYFIKEHGKYRNTYEIAWGLWFAKSFSISIDTECTQHISQIDNDVVALIALDLEQSALTDAPLDKDTWQKHMNAEELYGEHWLLAYEATVKGWLTPDTNYIDGDSFFTLLRKNRISFYDADRQIREYSHYQSRAWRRNSQSASRIEEP